MVLAFEVILYYVEDKLSLIDSTWINWYMIYTRYSSKIEYKSIITFDIKNENINVSY